MTEPLLAVRGVKTYYGNIMAPFVTAIRDPEPNR